MSRSIAIARSTRSNRRSISNTNSSLFFDGFSYYVSNNSIGSGYRNGGLPYSIELFAMLPIQAGGVTLFGNGSSVSSTSLFRIGIGLNGSLFVQLRNDSNVTLISSISTLKNYPTTKFIHIVFTDNNGTCKLYIDSVADGANFNYTPSGTTTIDKTSIGALIRGGAAAHGRSYINYVRTYNIALTQEQVNKLYANPSASIVTPTMEWLCGSGQIGTITDTSGNGIDGTINGAIYYGVAPSRTRKKINDNLVYNGDFEYYPIGGTYTNVVGKWINGTVGGGDDPIGRIYGWGIVTATGSVNVSFDTSTYHSGKCSIKLSTTGTNSLIAIRNSIGAQKFNAQIDFLSIPVLPNTSYTFSYWLKTTVTSGSAATGAYCAMNERDGNFINISTTGSPIYANTTTNWTRYESTFTTSATTRFICPHLAIVGNDGSATLIMDAWFDDIDLRPKVYINRAVVS